MRQNTRAAFGFGIFLLGNNRPPFARRIRAQINIPILISLSRPGGLPPEPLELFRLIAIVYIH